MGRQGLSAFMHQRIWNTASFAVLLKYTLKIGRHHRSFIYSGTPRLTPHITDDNDEEDEEDNFGFNMRRVEESRPASRAVKRPTFLSQLFYKPIIIIISAVFAIVSANDNR